MTAIIDIINPPAGAIPATREQLHALGVSDAEIDAGEKRFESRHVGAWSICASIRAIVAVCDYKPDTRRDRYFPARTAHDVKECGYHMEGRISLGGRKRHVFTSSQIFELPDGRLVNVAILHVCTR